MNPTIKANATLALASFGAGHFASEAPHTVATGAVITKRDDDVHSFPVDGPDRAPPSIVQEQAPAAPFLPFRQDPWDYWDEAAYAHNRAVAGHDGDATAQERRAADSPQ